MTNTASLITAIPRRLANRDDLNQLLLWMVDNEGSDLFLISEKCAYISRFSKKVAITDRKLSQSEIISMFSDFHGAHTQNMLGSGEPIDCSYDVRTDRGRFRFRANASAGYRNGKEAITCTFRSIPTTPPSAKDIGIERPIIETITQTVQGLIVISGATGNGKSTTLAACIRDLLEQPDAHANLITLEKPIEFVYDSIEMPSSFVTQMEVGRHIKTFSQGVHNTLRMAPSHILVGETRDMATAEASLEASITGHTVMTSLHANSCAQTVARLLAFFPESAKRRVLFDCLDALKMIIAQRLAPTIDGKRCAIREYLIFDEQIKEAILSASNLSKTIHECTEKYGQSMRSDIEAKYANKFISQTTYDKLMFNYQ